MGHVMRDLSLRWPNARIPFEVDSALPPNAKQILNDAIHFWNDTAGVLLTPHAGEPDYVFYRADDHSVDEWGGHSEVGRVGGKQIVRMDFDWSEAVSALLHETGHAAGLLHEHQRPDRDEFVNAPAVMDPDSQMITTGIPIGPYDCRSVMHYYISSSDPKAFRTKAPGCLYPFHGLTLSLGDINALQSLYWGCTWASRGMDAKDIGLGVDGSAWAIGSKLVAGGFDILRWNGSQWLTLPGGAVRISASSANSAWVVNSANVIFELVSNTWVQRPGAAQDIAACADSVWAIGTNPVPGGFSIIRWDGSNWGQLRGGAVRIAARSARIHFADRAFGTNSNIMRCSISSWKRSPICTLPVKKKNLALVIYHHCLLAWYHLVL
jgi:hypothetical protein